MLTLCVLALLNRHDSYAYEIASTLSDAIDMGEGTIYPLMRRMQSDGQVETYLVESPSGPSRKYYRLTDAGRRALDAQTTEWGFRPRGRIHPGRAGRIRRARPDHRTRDCRKGS